MLNESSTLYALMLRNARTMISSILCIVGLALVVCSAATTHRVNILAVLCLGAGVAGYVWEYTARAATKKLIAAGQQTQGTIEKITVSKYTNLHTSTFHMAGEDALHPYTTHFTYTVNGAAYHGQSNWHWQAPTQKTGDALTVYYDPAAPAHCTLND